MMRYSTLLLLTTATMLSGQSQTSQLIKRPSLQTGAIFKRWTTEANRKLDEFVVPLVVHVPVTERVSLSLLNTPTHAKLSGADTSFSLTAFTDTRLSAAIVLGEERALLNLGVGIPSGPTTLNINETRVAQEITAHALAMPTSYFGGGLEFSASLAAATEWGEWIIGGSLGGSYKGSYIPMAGSAKYLPGPEIYVSIGFDRPLGERSRIFGDIGYTWYGKDKRDGKNVFQADGKINFSLAGIWAAEIWQLSAILENRFKRQSPFALNSGLSVSYGNELDFSAELARQMNPQSAWLISSALKFHSISTSGNGKALVASLGPGWRTNLSAKLQMEIIARFAAGKLDDSRILGGEGNLGFVFQF